MSFQPFEGDFLGTIAFLYVFTAAVTIAAFLAARPFLHLSLTGHAILWCGFAMAVMLLSYPAIKGLWIGVLYLMTGLQKGDR